MPSVIAEGVATFAARVASLLGERAMRALARVNRSVTNPVVRQWAARSPYLAVIGHTGRRSGRRYRTPVMVFVEEGRLTVSLNYGVDSDWVRNVLAAGSAEVWHRGRRHGLADPHVVSAVGSAHPALTGTLTAAEPRKS
jgi:deazaflavin-dependent oxidoreductase (nitroreductase family)